MWAWEIVMCLVTVLRVEFGEYMPHKNLQSTQKFGMTYNGLFFGCEMSIGKGIIAIHGDKQSWAFLSPEIQVSSHLIALYHKRMFIQSPGHV